MIQNNHLADLYRRELNLPDAVFTLIEHEDAMVATVFKISQAGNPDQILKICTRQRDFLKESYFLNLFANKLPVPKIIQIIDFKEGCDGAILMECLQGDLLKQETLTKELAREIGSLLATIHLHRTEGYGDLSDPSPLNQDPRIHFTMKFEEAVEECKGHLSDCLLKTCRNAFNKDIDLLLSCDGPCVIHRDYRPGNLIVSDGKVRGIIDWSSAMGGFAEHDLCLLELGKWLDRFKKFLLEGYASIREIPNYTPLIPLMLLNKAIAVVGFTLKRGTWKSKDSKFYQSNLNYLESLAEAEEK